MADVSVTTGLTNGVSFGYIYTVGSDLNGTSDALTVDFNVGYDLAVSVMVLDSSGNVVAQAGDLQITFPEKGQVKIGVGSTFTWTTDDQVHIVAQRDSSPFTY